MSVLVWVAVGIAGALGALARFIVDGAVSERVARDFPWGTLAVNVSGSFLVGLLAGLGLRGEALLIAGAGVLGSFTTFSTWIFEAHRLGEDGEPALMSVNLVASLTVGLAAVAFGRLLGGIL